MTFAESFLVLCRGHRLDPLTVDCVDVLVLCRTYQVWGVWGVGYYVGCCSRNSGVGVTVV